MLKSTTWYQAFLLFLVPIHENLIYMLYYAVNPYHCCISRDVTRRSVECHSNEEHEENGAEDDDPGQVLLQQCLVVKSLCFDCKLLCVM